MTLFNLTNAHEVVYINEEMIDEPTGYSLKILENKGMRRVAGDDFSF